MSRRVIHALTLVILFTVTARESAAEQPCPVAGEADLSTLLDAIDALPMGGWLRANQNSFSDVWTPDDLRPLDGLSNPPPSKIIEAWSGFAWDCRRSDLLLFGGGHANYSGNDTYRWRARSGLWERMSLPSEVVKIGGSNSIEFAAVDGPYAAPIAAHTYDTNIYLPFADRFLVFGGAAYGTGGGFHVQQADGTFRTTGPYFFNPAKADAGRVGGTTGSHVQRVAPHPEILGGSMWENRDIYEFLTGDFPTSFVYGTTAYKSSQGKDVVFVTGTAGGSTSFELYSYTVSDPLNPLSDAVQKLGQYWDGFDEPAAGAYDPDLNAYVLVAKVGGSATFIYWDLNTAGPANRNVNFSPAGLTAAFGNASNFGMDYDPVRRQFVLWDGGAQVWVLKPPAQLSGIGWTIELVSAPTTATPDKSLQVNGVYGKWKYVGELDAFVGLQGVSAGNVWIYKPLGWRRPGSAPIPVLTFTATPASIASGAATTLAWSTTDATSCTASGGWSGAKATSGSQSSGALAVTTGFTLACSGIGGSVQRSVTVTVVPPPTLTFTATPTSIASGAAANLTWSTTDSTSCTASGDWSGTTATSGSQSSGPLSATTSFTLACGGIGGSVQQSVTVTVVPAPTLTFTATPTSIANGAAATLAWSSIDATTCTASGGWSGAKATSGSQSTSPLVTTTSFTLDCSGTGGSIQRNVTVTVVPAPTLTFTATPTGIASGAAATLAWSTTDATSCTASGGWSGAKATSGSQSSGALSTATNFTLTCSGTGGSVSRSVSVTINTAPTVTFSALAPSVASGGSTTLTWSSSNATGCTASGGWSGAKATSGSQATPALTATTTFNLSCDGSGGSTSQSVTVTVAPAPTVTLSASPTTVAGGSSATLTWSSTDATSCSASGGWLGIKASSGSETTAPLSATSTFTLSCSGTGGSANQSVTVTVIPPPTVALSVAPSSIASGSSATLTWSTTNATSCTASGGWSGAKATSGTQSTGPVTATTTYTLTCAGGGGSGNQSATLTVVPAPTVTLSANPTSVASGGSSTLTWSSTNATSCTASGGWSGDKATSGAQPSGPLSANTSFTLACTGTGGTTQQNAAVAVIAPPPPPSLTLTATPASVTSGAAATLAWSTTNATACTASGGWNGARATSDSQSSGPLTATTSFTLACSGAGGSIQQSVTVAVVTPPPTLSFTATPDSVTRGAAANLSWSATDATTCSATGAWSGDKAVSGSQSTGAIRVASTYDLSCTGPGGVVTREVSVSVLTNNGHGSGGGGAFTPASVLALLALIARRRRTASKRE